MTRQRRIVNRLLETAQLACANKDIEVIMSVSTEPEDSVRTWVEASQTTMLTVGVSMAVKSAIAENMPLFILQELIAKMYEDVRDGKECKENESD